MQLETPNDITLKADDAELAHATLLTTEGATCVAVRNDEVAITRERGVKPLLQWISEGRSFEGWSVADKVVGKAPALLYVQLKPAAVYAIAMSEAARDILLANGIACGCEDLVPFIVNRAGDEQFANAPAKWQPRASSGAAVAVAHAPRRPDKQGAPPSRANGQSRRNRARGRSI